MARRLLAIGGLAGFVLALVSFVRRSGARRRERVDLYYDDGSMVSLPDGSPESERLLALGREALRAARA
jgi:hypothetical protein